LIDARRVDFIAVPVSDLAGAQEFYGEALGLVRNPNTSGDRWVEYETGNLTVALSTFGGGVAIGVPDVDEARGKLEDAGVEFGMDTFDSGVCNGAPFADPDGNRLLLHHRYAPLEAWDPPATDVRRTDFVSVSVTDRGRSSEFYNLGFILITPEQKGGGEYTPEYSIALRVPDVAASMDRLRSAGVEFAFPEVYDTGVCHMAFFSDPDGNSLILHHRHAPYSDGSMP
jgi:predicted enzyme related to lactoylglutathione lyase